MVDNLDAAVMVAGAVLLEAMVSDVLAVRAMEGSMFF
jgi:hypothetical protein